MDKAMALPARMLAYSTCHPVKSSILAAAALFAFILVAQLASPGEADAIAPLLVGAIAVATLVGGGVAIDAASGSISDIFRDGCNTLLTLSTTLMHWSSDVGMLTDTFNNLIPGVSNIIQGIHQNVAIPIANIVLAIFLVVGLLKVVSRAGQQETGIDVWQLCMVFILYAFMKTVIDMSYELMVLAYDLVRQLIIGTQQYGFTQGTFTVQGIPEDVTGAGWLLAALIICLLVLFISFAVAVVTFVVVMMRSVQIYVYTAFASIPLAFFITDSSRSVATGFLKRYLAVLAAGVVMALLLVMQSAIIGQMGALGTTVDSLETGVQFLAEIALSAVSCIAFAFCMARSGAWARDFMGI